MLLARAIPDLPIGASRAHPLAGMSMDERVVASRARARRQWVFRSLLLLSVTAGALILMIIWKRDESVIRMLLRSLEKPAEAMQVHVNRIGLLPATLPEADKVNIAYYASYADRFYAQQADQPVIVAAGPTVRLALQTDGRCVILYDQGRISTAWMSLKEFHSRMVAQMQASEAFERQRRASPPELP